MVGESVGDDDVVVGRNGGGKSTLLKVLAGVGDLDSGRVTIAGGTDLSLVAQAPVMTPGSTVRQQIFSDIPTHEWASQSGVREILAGLLGGHSEELLDVDTANLSGGERQRVALAAALVALATALTMRAI